MAALSASRYPGWSAVPAGRRRHFAPAAAARTRSKRGTQPGVHLLVGTNRHEVTLFNLMDSASPPSTRRRDRHPLGPVVRRRRGDARRQLPGPPARCGRPRAVDRHRHRRGVPHPGDPAGRDAAGARAGVDVLVHVGDAGVRRRAARSTHALEIPFVFDTLDAQGAAMFTGERHGPPGHRRRDAPGVDRASRGPATRTTPASPSGPQYELGRRATMRFDATTEVLDDPMGDDRALGRVPALVPFRARPHHRPRAARDRSAALARVAATTAPEVPGLLAHEGADAGLRHRHAEARVAAAGPRQAHASNGRRCSSRRCRRRAARGCVRRVPGRG